MKTIENPVFRYVKTPILPTVLFINGSLVYLGITYFIGAGPSHYRTGLYYLLTFLWAFILHLRKRSHENLQFTLYDAIFLSFIIIIIVSLLWSGESLSGVFLIKFFFFVVFSYALGRLCGPQDVIPLICTICATGFIGVLLATLDSILHPQLVFSWVRPLFFELPHTNNLLSILIGQMIVALAIYSLNVQPGINRARRLFAYLGIIFFSGLLIFLMSRGIVLSTLIVGLMVALYPYSTSWPRRVMVIVSLMAGLAIASPFLPKGQNHLLQHFNVLSKQVTPGVADSLASKGQNHLLQDLNALSKQVTPGVADSLASKGRSDLPRHVLWGKYENNSVAIRMILWEKAFSLFLEHPIFGVGAGNFGTFFGKKGVYPHNTTLQVLAEFGSLGVLYILFYFLILIRLAYLSWQNRNGGKTALTLFVVSGLWFMYLLKIHIYGDFHNNLTFMFYSGFAVAMIKSNTDHIIGVG